VAGSAILQIKILADAAQAAKTFQDSAGEASKFAAGMRSAALPALAVGAALGVMAKSAAEDAQAQTMLANSLTNATGATAAQVAAVEDWITKTTLASGVADDVLRPAMATLARATGDVSTAQAAMATAMDVSAATGKPLETVADALAKGYAGNTGALGRLVPGLDSAVLATKDMTAITAELSRLTGGAAAANAETAAGKFQRMQVALAETKESIGAALLPVLEQLGSKLAVAAGWAANNAGIIQKLALALGAVAAIILVVNAGMAAYNAIMTVVRVATLAWTAVQWLLNVALTANPIGIVIVVIAALVAAIVLAYKHSETFRNIVAGAWAGIQAAASATWDFLKPVFEFIIGYYRMLWNVAQTAAAFIVAAWRATVDGIQSAWNWIKKVFDAYIEAVRLIMTRADEVRDNVVAAFLDMGRKVVAPFKAIGEAIKEVVDWVEKFINKVTGFKLPSWLTSGLSSIAGAVGLSVVAAPVVNGRAARAAPTAGGARAQQSLNLQVDVFLDGQRMRGYVDRVVTSHLEADGAVLAAGAWGTG
jgi:phage-related minor tail protein